MNKLIVLLVFFITIIAILFIYENRVLPKPVSVINPPVTEIGTNYYKKENNWGPEIGTCYKYFKKDILGTNVCNIYRFEDLPLQDNVKPSISNVFEDYIEGKCRQIKANQFNSVPNYSTTSKEISNPTEKYTYNVNSNSSTTGPANILNVTTTQTGYRLDKDEVAARYVYRTCDQNSKSLSSCISVNGITVKPGSSISFPTTCTPVKEYNGEIGSICINYLTEDSSGGNNSSKLNPNSKCISIEQIELPFDVYHSIPTTNLYKRNGIFQLGSGTSGPYKVTLSNKPCNPEDPKQRLKLTRWNFNSDGTPGIPNPSGIYGEIVFRDLNSYLDIDFGDSGGVNTMKLVATGGEFKYYNNATGPPETYNITDRSSPSLPSSPATVYVNSPSGVTATSGGLISLSQLNFQNRGSGYSLGTCYNIIGDSVTKGVVKVTSVTSQKNNFVLRPINDKENPRNSNPIKYPPSINWILFPRIDMKSKLMPTLTRGDLIESNWNQLGIYCEPGVTKTPINDTVTSSFETDESRTINYTEEVKVYNTPPQKYFSRQKQITNPNLATSFTNIPLIDLYQGKVPQYKKGTYFCPMDYWVTNNYTNTDIWGRKSAFSDKPINKNSYFGENYSGPEVATNPFTEYNYFGFENFMFSVKEDTEIPKTNYSNIIPQTSDWNYNYKEINPFITNPGTYATLSSLGPLNSYSFVRNTAEYPPYSLIKNQNIQPSDTTVLDPGYLNFQLGITNSVPPDGDIDFLVPVFSPDNSKYISLILSSSGPGIGSLMPMVSLNSGNTNNQIGGMYTNPNLIGNIFGGFPINLSGGYFSQMTYVSSIETGAYTPPNGENQKLVTAEYNNLRLNNTLFLTDGVYINYTYIGSIGSYWGYVQPRLPTFSKKYYLYDHGEASLNVTFTCKNLSMVNSPSTLQIVLLGDGSNNGIFANGTYALGENSLGPEGNGETLFGFNAPGYPTFKNGLMSGTSQQYLLEDSTFCNSSYIPGGNENIGVLKSAYGNYNIVPETIYPPFLFQCVGLCAVGTLEKLILNPAGNLNIDIYTKGRNESFQDLPQAELQLQYVNSKTLWGTSIPSETAFSLLKNSDGTYKKLKYDVNRINLTYNSPLSTCPPVSPNSTGGAGTLQDRILSQYGNEANIGALEIEFGKIISDGCGLFEIVKPFQNSFRFPESYFFPTKEEIIGVKTTGSFNPNLIQTQRGLLGSIGNTKKFLSGEGFLNNLGNSVLGDNGLKSASTINSINSKTVQFACTYLGQQTSNSVSFIIIVFTAKRNPLVSHGNIQNLPYVLSYDIIANGTAENGVLPATILYPGLRPSNEGLVRPIVPDDFSFESDPNKFFTFISQGDWSMTNDYICSSSVKNLFQFAETYISLVPETLPIKAENLFNTVSLFYNPLTELTFTAEVIRDESDIAIFSNVKLLGKFYTSQNPTKSSNSVQEGTELETSVYSIKNLQNIEPIITLPTWNVNNTNNIIINSFKADFASQNIGGTSIPVICILSNVNNDSYFSNQPAPSSLISQNLGPQDILPTIDLYNDKKQEVTFNFTDNQVYNLGIALGITGTAPLVPSQTIPPQKGFKYSPQQFIYGGEKTLNLDETETISFIEKFDKELQETSSSLQGSKITNSEKIYTMFNSEINKDLLTGFSTLLNLKSLQYKSQNYSSIRTKLMGTVVTNQPQFLLKEDEEVILGKFIPYKFMDLSIPDKIKVGTGFIRSSNINNAIKYENLSRTYKNSDSDTEKVNRRLYAYNAKQQLEESNGSLEYNAYVNYNETEFITYGSNTNNLRPMNYPSSFDG